MWASVWKLFYLLQYYSPFLFSSGGGGARPAAADEGAFLSACSLPRPQHGPQGQAGGQGRPPPDPDVHLSRTFDPPLPLRLQMYAEQRRSSDNMSARSSDSDMSDVSVLSHASSASRLSSASYMSIQSERPGGRLRSVLSGSGSGPTSFCVS